MATEYLFSNNATTTLAQSVSATATVLNVASGDGDLFPSPSSGQAFAVTLVDAATGLTNEICYCTSRSGDQLTVVRGQEGTNAIAWAAGDTCANYITADVMESWLQESDLDGYATQSWSEDLFVQQGNGGNTSNSGATYAWIDLVTESGYPRLGVTAANGTTYGLYGIAKVNALIGACLGNTNSGITGALAGTSLCVNPADGLPYLAYNGNTEIAALALDSAKVDKTTGDMSALDVEISGGYLKMTNTSAPGYATWFRDTSTATDGVLDLYSNVGGSDTNVMRITADGGINILGSGTFQKDGADVAFESDLENYVKGSSAGNKLIAFQISSVAYVSGGTYIAFPDGGFSGTPVSIVATTNADADMDVMTFNWTASGFYVNIPSETNSQNHPVSIMAVGPA